MQMKTHSGAQVNTHSGAQVNTHSNSQAVEVPDSGLRESSVPVYLPCGFSSRKSPSAPAAGTVELKEMTTPSALKRWSVRSVSPEQSRFSSAKGATSSTWVVSHACSRRDRRLHLLHATADVCSRPATERQAGPRLITSTIGLETVEEPISQMVCSSADITTCSCTTITGKLSERAPTTGLSHPQT